MDKTISERKSSLLSRAMLSDDQEFPAGKCDRREISLNILRSLRIISRAAQAHSRMVEKKCGVSGAELWMMWEILHYPGIRVSELAASMAIQASTCSNLLVKLQEKGLIRRVRSDPDHRAVRVYLTERGAQLMSRAPQPAQGYLQEGLRRMSGDCLRDLNAGLEQLVKNFTGGSDESSETVPHTEKE